MVNRVKGMDVCELKSLNESWDRRKEDPMRGSPADIQRRYIKIELKRRGRATFSKSQLFTYYSLTRSYQCMNPSRPSKGGTQLAAMVEGFIQTEAGKAIVGKMVN